MIFNSLNGLFIPNDIRLCYFYRTLTTASCGVHTTLVYMSLDTSVWILVVFTGERILSVFTPYKVKNICSRVTSLVLIAVIVVVMLVLNSHFIYGLSTVTEPLDANSSVVSACTYINSEYKNFVFNMWPWIDFCVFNLVPFLLLSIGNTCIAVRVVISRRRAKKVGDQGVNQTTKMTTGSSARTSTFTAGNPAQNSSADITATLATGPSAHNGVAVTRTRMFTCAVIPASCAPTGKQIPGESRETEPDRPGQGPSDTSNRGSLKLSDQALAIRTSAKNDRTSSMTAILLLLNMVFLATTTPVSVFFIIQNGWSQSLTTNKEIALFKLTFAVVNLIQYVNNSINFILYCITGSRFRKELQAMLFKRNRVFPTANVGVRRLRALEREVTGLHTRVTVATEVGNEAQVPSPPQFFLSRNTLTVPRPGQADTHI